MMEAVRQFHKVTNGTITIQLPVDFPAEEVEVIILPKQTAVNGHAQTSNDVERARQSFFNMDTSSFTPEQLQAFNRTCMLLRKGRQPNEPRRFGLFAGLVEIADDFNELPEDDINLFYADNLFPKPTETIEPAV